MLNVAMAKPVSRIIARPIPGEVIELPDNPS
jgi:hypothetical protein